MKKVIVGILAVIGLFAILAVFALAGLSLISLGAKPGVPGKLILEANFEGGVVEVAPDDPFAELMYEDTLQVRDIVDALDRAADDSRVKAFVAKIGGSGISMAHLQEIRDAVKRFRASGKPAVAFSETFGEFGPGNGGYYLATAFDEVYMQPSGDIGLTGLILESMFVRGTLDKLDVVPRMGQRKEYKNAMNYYTHREFTDAHRESLQRLMDSWFEQMLDGISESRGKSIEDVRGLMNRGPYLGQEALDAGLVDGLAYRDEVYAQLEEDAGRGAEFLYLSPYLERAGRPNRKGTTVALIHGYGAVTRGGSAYSPLTGSATMGSDSVGSAIRAAVEDDRVKAILFRVDSPGGSFVGSDTIWRETIRAKEAGKPLVVSMGSLAGSGGYYVAMHADKIVAQPGTITASIGVLGGKLITTGFWKKIGVTFDAVQTSTNSAQWSPRLDYSAEGDERFQSSLDRIYDVFTRNVADGRGMSLDEIQKVAGGRIWTGEDAQELGLVDELGGYHEALGLIREALELEADDPLKIKRFPRRRTAFEMLVNRGADRSSASLVASLARSLRSVQPQVQALERLIRQDTGVLTMPQNALPAPQ